MVEAVFLTKPGEMLKARLNQPRVSLEYLRQQEIRHRQASEEFSKAAKSATSKPRPKNTDSGAEA
jgi:hypothetical protein